MFEHYQALDPVLTKTINKIIQTEGYITHSMYIKDISTEGGNYLSLLKEVDIKGATENNTKETNLFIKQCLPVSDKNVVSSEELFSNEIFTYTELAEILNELQGEFNLPYEERYHFVKCYNENNKVKIKNILIFDNMTKKGFKIYDRFNIMPLKAIKLSIQQLAKFHGFSIVLKQYRTDFYRDEIQTKTHPLVFNDNATYFVTSLCKMSLEYLEGDRKTKLEKYLPGLINKYNRFLHNNEYSFKCLCHGDYRMNNILVKEKSGGTATIIPIDYQAIFYGSPITDLLYMIFMSTDQKFRKEHLEDLKKIYYESLDKFVKYFNIELESVYPEKEFENDFNNHLEYGLIVSLIVLPLELTAEDDVPELNSDIKTMKLHENFKPRVEEIVDDFIEWGYL